jgi:hypothetical protein
MILRLKREVRHIIGREFKYEVQFPFFDRIY